MNWRKIPWTVVALALLALFPLLHGDTAARFGDQIRVILVYCILALALNIVVGYSGQLHLGIAAFFAIGAYTHSILVVPDFPFQTGFWIAIVVAMIVTAVAGVILSAPTLRLRGDYLALVTLGFGEVILFSIRNLENITNGPRNFSGIPAPGVPGLTLNWTGNYRYYYYLSLLFLALVVWLLHNLERSRLGRAWLAIREDELAATCMGMNAARVKLSALAMGAALAGLSGALYVTTTQNTGYPEPYTFNRSITVLCILIIGGMGSLRGALLGTFILLGYENIFTDYLDKVVAKRGWEFKFTDVKLIVFGLALILMMRFRPKGVLPERREEPA